MLNPELLRLLKRSAPEVANPHPDCAPCQNRRALGPRADLVMPCDECAHLGHLVNSLNAASLIASFRCNGIVYEQQMETLKTLDGELGRSAHEHHRQTGHWPTSVASFYERKYAPSTLADVGDAVSDVARDIPKLLLMGIVAALLTWLGW